MRCVYLSSLLFLFFSGLALQAQTYTADDKLNGIINESQGMTSEQLVQIFSENPNYRATCYPAKRDFPEKPFPKQWSSYKGELKTPTGMDSGNGKPFKGAVAFNFKFLNEESYDIDATIHLDVSENLKKMFNSPKPIPLICPNDETSICRNLTGPFDEEKDVSPSEIFTKELLEKKEYRNLTRSGQISFSLPKDGDGRILYMRMAIQIHLFGKKDTVGAWIFQREVKTDPVDQYLGRFVCRLELNGI